MRKALLTISILGALAFPALAQTTDDNTSPGGTIRGPNEQVAPDDGTATGGTAVDGTTTETTLPRSDDATPKDSTTENVGGAGIEPDQNPQSSTFGTNSN